jgi:GNAT superfamily N-acetyltransferase
MSTSMHKIPDQQAVTRSPVEVNTVGEDDLVRDRVWWEIYQDSFPANEREPAGVIFESLRRRVGVAYRARSNGATIGIATTHLLMEPAAVFLVYLAADREHRGEGLGADLLELAWRDSTARLVDLGLRPQGMVWEVDPPGATGDPVQLTLRKRRIAFFQRHAGVPLSRPYFQPPLGGGDPVPMQLMFRPAENMPVPHDEMVRALVQAIYLEKYRAINNIPESTLTELLARQ